MNRRIQYVLVLILSSAPFMFGVAASGGDPKRSGNTTADSSRSVETREEKWERDPIVFSAQDRDAIRIYFRDTASNPAVGQTKSNGHHLQRNGLLPQRLQNQVRPLSNDLELRLHPLYSGYTRGMIGHDMVIIESRTLRIMDIIRDATGHR
ncbi:MAG TPA: hypothetical protein VN577_11565 [Terriglobales bacterium]|nr:hypothetical protein [Terriglobales bacterium]